MRKITFFLIFLFLLLVFIVFAFLNGTYQWIDDAFISILMIGTAIGGFAGLILQHNRETNIKEAEFLISFNTTFVQSDIFMGIYNYCAGRSPKDYVLNPVDVLRYMDYFEPLYFLLENKVIHADKLVLLIEHRFKTVYNNDEVKKIGLDYPGYFDVVDKLYDIIDNATREK